MAPSRVTVAEMAELMEQIAPLKLSEPWDNTGLLLGDPQSEVQRVMTCLTLTDVSVQEAIDGRASLAIAHHPLPFKPLSKITTATATGRLIWRLASSQIAVYCPHTAWDSAPDGINAQLARKLSLSEVEPLVVNRDDSAAPSGSGRWGKLSRALDLPSIARKLCQAIPHCRPRAVACEGSITRIGIGCGSGGSFLAAAASHECQLLITGEATFHTCLEAEALGMGLLMIGHFASEKFAMDQLAARLASAYPALTVWSSLHERDPVNVAFPSSEP